MLQRYYVISALSLCALLPGLAAAAPLTQQDLERDLSILTRKHPEFDPMGVRADDFIITPRVKVTRAYNDNIYYVDRAMTGDALFVLSPAVTVKSDFARHQLQLDVGMDKGSYDSLSDEDYMDYRAGIGGRVDITGALSAPIATKYSHQHARRSSPDDHAGFEPAEYDLMTQKAGLTYANKSFTLKGMGGFEHYSFQDVQTLSGLVNNHDRNRDVFTGDVSLGMAEEGYVVPFLYTGMKEVDYIDAVDDSGVNRDATEVYFGIGADVDLSSILHATAKVGTVSHDMQDARFATSTAMDYVIDLTWEPSTLAAFTLTGQKTIEETSLAGFAVSVDSSIGLTAKYELAPNIIVSPGIEYLLKEYDGAGGGSLEQELAMLNVTYKLNRNLWVDLTYHYAVQDIVTASPQLTAFESNTIMLSLTAHY